MKILGRKRVLKLSRTSLFGTLVLLGSLNPSPAWAHKPSDGFLTIKMEAAAISGQLDIAVKDLEMLLAVDNNRDLKVTWGELNSHREEIYRYGIEHLRISSNGAPCSLAPRDLLVTNYSDGAYATVLFNTSCTTEATKTLVIDYDLLFDLDAQHRGLLNLSYRDSKNTFVFTNQAHSYQFEAVAAESGTQIMSFVKEGLLHIYHGYDHMLFLIALVLPAVYFRERRTFRPHASLRPVLLEAFKVITAFTLAHTVSLALTSFQIISPPPSRLLESLVASTVLLTAINNLYPLMKEKRWLAGFGFGLIHGMAFASVLTDLGLKGWHLAFPLVGFNLGVELAQATIVGSFLPVAFLLRNTGFYRTVFLTAGSVITAILALIWMSEQILNVSIISP